MIQIRDGLRFNIYASATIDGVRYPDFTDRSIWPKVGITEVDDPLPPPEYQPAGWVMEEIDAAPYVVWRPMTAAEIKARVPSVVTMRQGREALIRNGLFAQVDAALNAIGDPGEKAIALNYWEYSQVMERGNPVVQQLAPALGLTEAQLDALFTQAATL